MKMYFWGVIWLKHYLLCTWNIWIWCLVWMQMICVWIMTLKEGWSYIWHPLLKTTFDGCVRSFMSTQVKLFSIDSLNSEESSTWNRKDKNLKPVDDANINCSILSSVHLIYHNQLNVCLQTLFSNQTLAERIQYFSCSCICRLKV